MWYDELPSEEWAVVASFDFCGSSKTAAFASAPKPVFSVADVADVKEIVDVYLSFLASTSAYGIGSAGTSSISMCAVSADCS